MDREGIKQLVREIFGVGYKVEDQPKWVSLPCPLSRWTHARGKDSRPSAGISIQENGHSVFNCYSCHTTVPLYRLLEMYQGFSGEDLSDYIEVLEEDEDLATRIPEWGARAEEGSQTLEVLSEDLVEIYEPLDPDNLHPYIKERGVSYDTAERLGLRIDPADSEGEERIVFPVRGRDGSLHGFSGRATSSGARLKVRDYFGLPKRLCLLGAHLVTERTKYIVLVEGLFDYALMRQYRIPALAFMSSTLTEPQAEIVKDIGLPTYIFHDNDQAGESLRDKAAEALCRFVPTMKVTYPSRKVRDAKTGKMRPLKDPGELRKKEAYEMLEEAEIA